MVADFDSEALHALVDAALAPIPPVRAVSASLPLAWGDTELFEYLAEILPGYLGQTECQAVLAKLRARYSHGVERANLGELHAVVGHCRRCPNLSGPVLPQGNVVDPDLVVVTTGPDWPAELIATFVDAGFAPSRVCITSATRCRPQRPRPPTTAEVANCNSYLTGELGLLAARLVMTMGNIATTAVLGSPRPIATNRGQIFWLGPHPVMAVYGWEYAGTTSARSEDLAADLAAAHRFLYGT